MSDICFVCGDMMGWGDRVHTDAGTRHHGCVPFGTDVESEQDAEALEDLEDYLLNPTPPVPHGRSYGQAMMADIKELAQANPDYANALMIDEAAVRIAAQVDYDAFHGPEIGQGGVRSWQDLEAIDPLFVERIIEAMRVAIAAYLAEVRRRDPHNPTENC